METILKIEQIEKYYGNRSSLTKALDTISFEVEKGEFIAIMGASGSGKTTLLNCISTLDKVSSGKIYMEGDDITRLKGNQLNRFRREKLGFIFQEFNLLDTLTAFEKLHWLCPSRMCRLSKLQNGFMLWPKNWILNLCCQNIRMKCLGDRNSVWPVPEPW